MLNLAATHRFLVSPDGMTGYWLHRLDLSTGEYPQYADWIDATDLNDEDFEALIVKLQNCQCVHCKGA